MLLQLTMISLSTFAVAILYQVPPKTIIPAGLVGTLAWIIHLKLNSVSTVSPVASVFLASLWVGTVSEWLARFMRVPATVFAISGIVTLVPGTAAFQTMRAFSMGDSFTGITRFTETSLTAASLAAGLVVAGSLARLRKKGHPHDKIRSLIP